MAEPDLPLHGMAYVPGVARGVLRHGAGQPGSIALLGDAQAVDTGDRPAAFIVANGAPLSHRIIGLAALGIPTVLISAAQARLLEPGSELLVDGASGWIASARADSTTATPPPPAPMAGQPVRLADGTPVWLLASVRGTQGAGEAVARGAAGIGLVRSEFLGADEVLPPDAAYFTAALETLCSAAAPLRVTLRLVDLAADKPPRWLHDAQHLLHPLGMQGARLFPREPVRSVLQAQLEALAALSERFALEVLIPYLGSREELLHWTGLVRRSLPQGVQVGAMLETPAALLDLANWMDIADFFAIGCNDLMQCLFGADRDEPGLRSSLDPYAPVLYRLLGQAAAGAGELRDRLRLCGVLPRLTGILPLLVGLGFRRFSVDPVWIPYLARDLRSLTLSDAQDLGRRVTDCTDSRAVRERLGVPTETPTVPVSG